MHINDINGIPVILSDHLVNTCYVRRTWRERLLSLDLPGPWHERPWEPFRVLRPVVTPSGDVLMMGSGRDQRIVMHPALWPEFKRMMDEQERTAERRAERFK